MAKNYSNAEVDTLAAAVAAPYGPLTRVTDFTTLPDPNGDVHGDFTSALSVTVSLTPQELEVPLLALERLEGQHEWTAVVADMKTAITNLKTLADTMSTPHDYQDFQDLVDNFRANFPWFFGFVG